MPNLVYGSLSLTQVSDLIEENPIIWYADRWGKLLRMKIEVDDDQAHCLHQFFYCKIYQEYETTAYEYIGEWATIFFQRYYRYGHFFGNKNNALKYIHKRSQLNIKRFSKKAQEYLDSHPECLI